MSDKLKDLIVERAFADADLGEEATYAVMAALESDAELQTALSATASSNSAQESVRSAGQQASLGTGMFLKSLTVQAFRGIGSQVRIDIPPLPGLVVIAGRNGSGKSSLAEALEIALTGVNSRWVAKAKNGVWSKAWRNLHVADSPAIRVCVTEVETGVATIDVEWPDIEGSPPLARRWLERNGQSRQPIEALGWDRALELYRPLLSYDELGSALEGQPKDLYDQLHRLLGLEQLSEAIDRLDSAVSQLKHPATLFAEAKAAARASLATVGGEEAALLAKEVNRHTPIIAEVRRVVTRGAGFSIPAEWLAASTLFVPGPEEIQRVVRDSQAALEAVAVQSDQERLLEAVRLRLLREAVQFHSAGGDARCPVCGVGTLDESWQSWAQEQLLVTEQATGALAAARDQARQANTAVRALITSVLAVPRQSELHAAEAAAVAYVALSAVKFDTVSAVAELVPVVDRIRQNYGALRDEATLLIESKQDAWAPVMQVLAQWLTTAEEYLATDQPRTIATRAQKWLKDNADLLRNERLAPLADQAALIWAALRQESNVELGAIRLSGQKNYRHVQLLAEVDGFESEALSVMSQGELQALALAIFIPRATSDDSPFRFLVLDDPIQAMDPSKVEGFLSVMLDLARTRQIIVLTHDDRLPAAIRRRRSGARLLEVARGPRSEVSIVESTRPGTRLLDDGRAVTYDPEVSAEVKARTIPTLCREAMESVAWEVFAGRSIALGKSLSDLEKSWEDAKTVRQRLALAIHLDTQADIGGWLGKGARSRAMRVATRGLHDGDTNPLNALDATAETLCELRKLLG